MENVHKKLLTHPLSVPHQVLHLYLTPVLVVMSFLAGSTFNRAIELIPLYTKRDIVQAVLDDRIEILKNDLVTIKTQTAQVSDSIQVIRSELPHVVGKVENQHTLLVRLNVNLATVQKNQEKINNSLVAVSSKLSSQ